MKSPFPGMDPYLEAPGRWPGVHQLLISATTELLNRQLRPRYVAQVEERVYISDENDPARDVIVPDVNIIHVSNSPSAAATSKIPATDSAVAEPIVVTTLLDDEIHEGYVVITEAQSEKTVAVIEILSPSNKVAGSRGRSSYESKRHDVMISPAHLIEIDLLRAGMHIHTRERLPECDYTVHVSRKWKRPRAMVWPILLTQRLPVVPIPLKEDDAEAQLDLQELLSTVYERGAYDIVLDYSRDPIPPLPEKYLEWSQKLRSEVKK